MQSYVGEDGDTASKTSAISEAQLIVQQRSSSILYTDLELCTFIGGGSCITRSYLERHTRISAPQTQVGSPGSMSIKVKTSPEQSSTRARYRVSATARLVQNEVKMLLGETIWIINLKKYCKCDFLSKSISSIHHKLII